MIIVMSLSTVCKSPDKVRSSIKPILTDECSFSIGVGVLPHRTAMTPKGSACCATSLERIS